MKKLAEKIRIRSFGQRQEALQLVCWQPHFWQTRNDCIPGLAWWRSQALKPRQRHAEGVGLDGDAQRQATIFKP
jgi:hypothetical protein